MPATQPVRKESKRIHFTARTLDALPIPARGRVTYYDARSHLGLRVDANGIKSFFWFRTGPQGKPIFRSIGTWNATSIEKARAAANEYQGKLEGWRAKGYAGDDPFVDADAEYTFGELLSAYVDKRVSHYAARPERAKKEIKWMTEPSIKHPEKKKPLSAWMKKPLSQITDKAVRAMHREIAEKNGKTQADRSIQLVRRLFGWGIKEKMYTGANPALGVEYFGWTERERFLSAEEIARLFKAMKKDPNRDLIDFVSLSLWTGARRSDVLSMRWQDVLPFQDNTWRIPEPKGGEAHSYRVPLVAEAIEILQARKRSAKDGAVWVFPSTATNAHGQPGVTGHLVEMKRSWRQLLKRAKIEDLHIHDLRRSLGSWQAGLNTSLVIIGKTLGHRPGSSATAVYGRVDLEPVRASIAQAVAAMKLAAKIKPRLTA